MPFAHELKRQMEQTTHADKNSGTFFLGVNGCQGSGKSTMSAFLATYMKEVLGFSVVVLSLDDFYLTRQQRQNLAVKVHPLFSTRGVPGTHNTDLMNSVLSSLSGKKGSVCLPRFDKANDNPIPQADWTRQALPVDLVIMEGWCWGVKPQIKSALEQHVNELEEQEDPLGVWRKSVNDSLKEFYVDLYDYMDYWVMLKAPGFQHVFEWRLEQEQKLAASLTQQAKHLMDEKQIAQFIQYYQRLTEHGLATLPQDCDMVFELNGQRAITSVKGLS